MMMMVVVVMVMVVIVIKLLFISVLTRKPSDQLLEQYNLNYKLQTRHICNKNKLTNQTICVRK